MDNQSTMKTRLPLIFLVTLSACNPEQPALSATNGAPAQAKPDVPDAVRPPTGEPTIAGQYGPLRLGHNRDTGEITGWYSDSTGENGQFSCEFALRGVYRVGASTEVEVWYPGESDRLRAVLTVVDNEARISMNTSPGGCGNVTSFDTDPPPSFTLTRTEPWLAIRAVAVERAHLSATPNTTPGKAYLVKSDVVAVTASAPGWSQVTYTNDQQRTTTGWLHESDLHPISR